MSQKLKFPLIADKIIQKIESGEYPLHSELPTLEELTNIYSISRMTAQRALKILSRKGYVSARRGNKTRVISLRSMEKLSILRGKHIGLLANYALLSTTATPPRQMQLLYFLQKKLMELGNHVMGFQYVDDLDLRTDDLDCYIMFDPLGARSELQELLKKTGKPYLVIEIIGPQGCLPNHIHPLLNMVQLRLMNHFLKNDISHIVLAAIDSRSLSRNMSEEEFRPINESILTRLVGDLRAGLVNHQFPMENFIVMNCGPQEEQTVKMVEELIQNKRIAKKTAFISMCDNNAVGISKVLKRHDWKSKDYMISVFDPISKVGYHTPGAIGLDINQDEVFAQVIASLEYQFSNNTNYAPGSVVNTLFHRHNSL